jgi:ABC-type nitrate/sulfonate/bicarbonate transport system substrate-binding protein
MSSINLTVMYGHLEGAGGSFARDPSGFLSLESGIYARHRLNVTWTHVQGTEERRRRIEDGSAQISLVVGRASLQHFLESQATRVLGAVMNGCPYYLMAARGIDSLADLRGKSLACREAPARHAPISETFQERAQLRVGRDLTLQLPNGDHEAYALLADGKVAAALLPRPFGFIAEERGFKRIVEWPEIVDDPLPITIETTAKLGRERPDDLSTFIAAHREGVGHFKANRAEAIRILERRFGHSPTMAEKIFAEYTICMDETLKVDFGQFAKLLSQIAAVPTAGAQQVASEWIIAEGLKNAPQ